MITPRAKHEIYADGHIVIPHKLHVYVADEVSANVLIALQHFMSESGLLFERVCCFEQAELALTCKPEISVHKEFYRINLTTECGQVEFVDFMGGRNAAATLAQLLHINNGIYSFPVVSIEDWPDCNLRGIMVDPARRFFPVPEIKDTMRRMAMAKMSIIHLHLMDAQSYSVRSEAVSELGDDSIPQYSLDDLREIVCYGEMIGIECLPEIELVVHGSYMIQKLSALRCETRTIESSDCIMCVGTEAFYEIAEKLIIELATIFPCKLMHIGTDEIVAYDLPEERVWPTWYDCKHCRALAEQLGIRISTPEEVEQRFANGSILDDSFDGLDELLYHTIRRIHKIVTTAGKRMMMWNDNIDISKPVDLPRDILIHFWRIAAHGRGPYKGCSMAGFIDAGFEIVNSHYTQTYIEDDYYRPEVPLNTWSPLSYPKIDPARVGQILGGVACAWGNYEHFERTMPSSLAFYADRLWDSTPGVYEKDFTVAISRMILGAKTPGYFDVFEALGGYFLPRKNSLIIPDELRYGHPENVTISPEQVKAAAEQLRILSDRSTAEGRIAAVYVDCVEWVYDEMIKLQMDENRFTS